MRPTDSCGVQVMPVWLRVHQQETPQRQVERVLVHQRGGQAGKQASPHGAHPSRSSGRQPDVRGGERRCGGQEAAAQGQRPGRPDPQGTGPTQDGRTQETRGRQRETGEGSGRVRGPVGRAGLRVLGGVGRDQPQDPGSDAHFVSAPSRRRRGLSRGACPDEVTASKADFEITLSVST